MEIYTYANCTSCRNAESLANEHGVTATKRDIFKDPLSAPELIELFARIGQVPRQMLATRSRPHRTLSLADRGLSDEEIVALMAVHPALIRRPIVVTSEGSHVGFNRSAIESLIGRLTRSAEDDQHA